MNFSVHLLEFLKRQSTASVSNFGTFYLKNTSASLDETGKNILPPGKEIAFNDSDSTNNSDFAEYLASQQKSTLLEAEIEIRKQVNFWNSRLEKEGNLKIENLGTFVLNDSTLHFTGEKTENISADFYGLEEINISEIKNVKKAAQSSESYKMSKSLYWITPVVVGILTIAYFGITQPETLFGGKSFGGNIEKSASKKAVKVASKIDSSSAKTPLDSLKSDSLKSLPQQKTLPVQ